MDATIDSDDRTFSEQEFALILTRASEMARASDVIGPSSEGFSLAEIKAVAAEAGFDPALVERAARLMPEGGGPSRLERILGGPIRHRVETRYDRPLDDEKAARLLAAIRTEVEERGHGTAHTNGVTWQSAGVGTDWLVNAASDGEGTRLRVIADRRVALGVVGTATVIGTLAVGIATVLFFELIELQSQVLGWSTLSGLLLGTMAIGRSVWARATRRVPARIAALMDELGRVLGGDEDDAEDR
ncbi:MAG: DUF3110 domain-containing protein [Gemmatimonadetes bacterium]|nr:DUF3110 domain-containing protein [Gemmatimonadota bacterium]